MKQVIRIDIFVGDVKKAFEARDFLIDEGFFSDVEDVGEKTFRVTCIDFTGFVGTVNQIKEMVNEVVDNLDRKIGLFVWHCYYSTKINWEDFSGVGDRLVPKIRKRNYHHGLFGGDADDDD